MFLKHKSEIVPASSGATRRDFFRLAAVGSTSLMLSGPTLMAQQEKTTSNPQHVDGTFDWQIPNPSRLKTWKEYSFSIDRWWGEFAHDLSNQMDMMSDNPWAIGNFTKSPANPVLRPTPHAWDQGHFGGGVHNGSILVKDDLFYYIYRGERPIDIPQTTLIDYICDVGVATSRDGVHFTKDDKHSPFFRRGDYRKYSYEDVAVVEYDGRYYLFCNQWLWGNTADTSQNGVFLATSKDLLNWDRIGIVFPNAKKTHRNAVVLQDPHNKAVRASNGQFVMYIDDGLIAYSADMVHWESHQNEHHWPGGECCFALADYDSEHPGSIVHFTGGAHTGHFYAVGEVLLSKRDPETPLRWLPRSPLFAEKKFPYENGFSADAPHQMISSFADCIFFNGLTQHQGKWWIYYGGSEYYTCLATAPVRTHTNL